MRKIKFRAIDSENHIIPSEDIGCIEFMTDGTIVINNEIPIKSLELFTGQLDQSGKEIYEGDILESNYNCYKNRYIVLWNNDHSEYSRYYKANNTGGPFSFDGAEADDSIIIGNIHENPELLK